MYRDNYELWKTDEYFDEQTRLEVQSLKDEKEIEDRFYKHLTFGTGGMRGITGAGTNRLNRYTVGRATAGLGNYLIAAYDKCRDKGVVVAYDTRCESRSYAESTADVLTSMGFKVYIFDKAVPTPELSFAIRELDCIAGVTITASHNSKEYNGYKIYDKNGCQLVPYQVEAVAEYINKIEDFREIDFNGNDSLKKYIDLTDEFVDTVISQGILNDRSAKSSLKIVYTPINGTGNIPVRRTLAKAGFTCVETVKEQEEPDGNFPTVKTPNPEDESAMYMAVELAKKTGADVVIATDPDCDRVGTAVRTSRGTYEFLTGNQIGALMTDYILNNSDFTGVKNPAIVKTIVSSDLGAVIAKDHGFKVFSTLTGFKFIGEKITQFNESGDYTFVFGYEESYGYLKGEYIRDKDGVVSCLLICEMAALYKSQGMTLTDRLNMIYKKYGYCYDKQENFVFRGKDGAEKMSSIMRELRKDTAVFGENTKVIDYSKPVAEEGSLEALPKSNVMKFVWDDHSWVAIRPSGTEPKMKTYYSIRGFNKEKAIERFHDIKIKLKDALEINRI